MLPYQSDLKNYPFASVKRHYPHVQRSIYDTLLELTPSRLQFELHQIEEDREFCLECVDQDTYEIIGTVMSALLEENRLIMTRDDVILSFLRFKELLYIDQCVKQGLMVVQVTEKDIQYLYTVGEQAPQTERKPGKRYRRRL